MKTVKKEIKNLTAPDFNCRVIRDKDFGKILFGCPPEVIKHFYWIKETIPFNIVIPQRTFIKGRNIFDLEFITYSVIFSQKSEEILNIVCSETQEQRIRITLQEALFGPIFKDIFSSFLLESLRRFYFNKRQKASLENIVDQIATNQEIFSRFKAIMSLKLKEEKIVLKMKPVLRAYLKKLLWLANFAKNRIYKLITEAYVRAAMLKLEMNFFALCDERKRTEFLDSIICFHHFDENRKATLTKRSGLKLRIRQTENGLFKLYKNGKLVKTVDLEFSKKKRGLGKIAKTPFEIPELGITFLGSGTGFDPMTYTSCYIIWIEGKAIAVDLLSNCKEHFMRLGISPDDITHIFLSHLHADHDVGVIEEIMWGKKKHLLTSRLIFDSFLRKAEALTKVRKDNIKEFVYFTNLEPGKEIPVPGIDRTYIKFDYSFHSIPSGRFKLRYTSLSGKEYSIGFSGDTKYDKQLVNNIYKEGIITAKRRDEILGFLWDCDLIIHEAGGDELHTDAQELLKLPAARKRKMIVTHAGRKTRRTKGLRFAKEGETITILAKKRSSSIQEFLPQIKNTGLFPRLTSKQFDYLLSHSTIETFSNNQYVFKQGNIGHKFYIILSGFAEVIKNNKVISIYDKGSFFGELALINKDHKRRASIKAKSKLKVLVINREMYEKFHLTTNIHDRLYEFSNFFTEAALSSLYGHISQGKSIVFMKGECLTKFGDTSRDVFILLSGEVDILDSREKLITHIANVDVLGEIAFLKEIPRTATIRVTSKQAATIRLSSKLFTEINEKFPSFHATVLKKMEKRWNTLQRKNQVYSN